GGRCSPAQHQSQIDQFAFPPTPHSVPDLLAQAEIRHKSIEKLPPTGVSSPVVASRPTPFCQRDKAAIIETHRVPGQSPPDAAEWQIKKFTFRIAVNGPDQADVIAAYIEKKRGRHQIGVAHVVVFVLVQTLEPVTVGDGILLVVITKSLRHILARQAAREQIGHVVRGVRTKIEAWTVKRTEKACRLT